MLKYKQYNNYKNQQPKKQSKTLGLFKPRFTLVPSTTT